MAGQPWLKYQQPAPAADQYSMPVAPRLPPPQTEDQAALTHGQVGRLPLENQQTQVQIESTRANMGQIPLQNEATRTNIEQGRTSTRTQQQQAEQSLRDDYQKVPAVAAFNTVLPMYASAIRAGDTNAGDLQIVYAFSKLMDPGSVVRGNETDQAGGGGGVSQQVAGYVSALQGGGRLTPTIRRQLLLEMRNRAGAIADQYNQTRSQYEGLARQHGFSPDAIVGPHPAIPFQQAEADFVGHPIKNGNGFTYPKGQTPQGGQAPVLDPTGEGDIGFNNHAAAAALPPGAQEFPNIIGQAIREGKLKTADDLIRFSKQYGFDANPKEAEIAAQAIARGIMPVVDTPRFAKPDIKDARGSALSRMPIAALPGAPTIQQLDAGVRGVADTVTMGGADELAAAGDTLFGGGTMRSNLARQRAVDDYDQQNNAPQRMVGQAAGAALLPMGEINGVADLARMGGKYGAAYGVGSGRGNIGDRLLSGAQGGVSGAATAGGLGAGSQALGRFVRGRYVTPPPLIDQATGGLNQPLENVSAGQRVAAARQYGIDLPMDAAGDKTAAIIGKGFDISPASAGLMNDARRVTEGQVKGAVENVAGRFGGGRTLADAGVAAQQGARNWIARAEGVKGNPADRGIIGKAYDAIAIPPTAPTSLANTRTALASMLDVFRSNDKMRALFQNGTLKQYLQALDERPDVTDELGAGDPLAGVLRTVGRATQAGTGDLSWQDLKHFRSIIGEQIGEQRFSDSPLKSQLRGLYGALSEDMRATAAARGPRALQTFERANNLFRDVQGRIDGALVRILGDDSKNNPEAAAAAIQTIAQSNRGSANIRQLQQIRASMAKGGEWNEVASSLIRLMGQPAKSQGRDFEPQTFVRTYADMSEDARNLLFGDRGRAELRQALDGFVAVNQRLSKVNALRNSSQTAPNMSGRMATGAASGIVVAGAMNPLLGLKMAGVAAGSAAANYGMAKLWTNPAFVRWATGYSRVAAAGNPAAVASQIGRLQQVAAADPTLRQPLINLQQRLLAGINGNGQPNGGNQP